MSYSVLLVLLPVLVPNLAKEFAAWILPLEGRMQNNKNQKQQKPKTTKQQQQQQEDIQTSKQHIQKQTNVARTDSAG